MLLAALAVSCVAGAAARGLASQPLWTAQGWQRFLAFAAIYAATAGALVFWRPRQALAWLAAGAGAFTAFAAGPAAAFGVAWAAAGTWAAGWLLWREAGEPAEALQITLGLAVWASLVMWSAALPVHFAWTYWLLPAVAMAAAWRKGWRPGLRLEGPSEAAAAAAWCAGLFPLFAHWLMVLKPDVSADGLAMHLVIPARMAQAHHWPFDPAEFAWALMPMGGDWVWTIGWQLGGEAGARLMNLLLLALLARIVGAGAGRALPPWPAALLTGAFLSTSLVQHVTGSLFVENATALWLTAAAVVLAGSGLAGGRARMAFGLLLGMAAATKFGALAFVVPLLAGAAWATGWLAAAQALLWAAPAGVFPYVNAWLRTGNPLFPFFNKVFRSPWYEAANFRDTRFETPLGWTTLYDLTFHSRRFIEGFDGAAGFLLLALLPVCVAAWRPSWPKARTVLLASALGGGLLSYAGQSNLRYLYPVLPLAALAAAEALGEPVRAGRVASFTAGAALAVVMALHLVLLPAAGHYHREFFVPAWLEPARDVYWREYSPERKLVEWLNRNAPGAKAAWFDGNAIGDYRGRAYTASWHSPWFWKQLREARDAEAVERLLRELEVEFVIASRPGGRRAPQSVHERQLLDDCMERVLEFGDVELRRWNGGGCRMGEPPAAAPGVHDETSPSLRFQGAWIRDLQFPQTYRGTLVYSFMRDAQAVLRFEGTAARLMYTAAFNRCRARVLLDGKDAGGFDQRSQQTRWQQWSPWFEAGQAGAHTLILGIAPGSPASCALDLDAFEVR